MCTNIVHIKESYSVCRGYSLLVIFSGAEVQGGFCPYCELLVETIRGKI